MDLRQPISVTSNDLQIDPLKFTRLASQEQSVNVTADVKNLHARAEYEQVGRKPLDDGFVSVPVKEFRGALARPFGRMEVGVNFLLVSRYTGQTTKRWHYQEN